MAESKFDYKKKQNKRLKMSQSDYNIAPNPSGLAMRTEVNVIFDSILTNNSGSTAPTVTSAFMMWVDTSNSNYYYLKMRNHDNTAWVILGIYTVATKAYISYIDGDQTISGIKTFGSFPITPMSAPTLDYQVANKKYVDDNATVDTASETASGIIEIATTSEAQTGTDDLKAITPLKLKNTLDARLFVKATAVNSTSGTSIDFTGIPSWAKKITIMLNGVSTNNVSCPVIQLGAGSFQTSGYNGSAMGIRASAVSSGVSLANSSYFNLIAETQNSSELYYGVISLINFSGNIWCESANIVLNDASRGGLSAGSVTLSSSLDRIRITTVNGTDTFDAGQINIMYEG